MASKATSNTIFLASRQATTLVQVFQLTQGTQDIQYLSLANEIADTPLISDAFVSTWTPSNPSVFSKNALIQIDKYKVFWNGSFDDVIINGHYGSTRVGGVVLTRQASVSNAANFDYEAEIEVIDASKLILDYPDFKPFIDVSLLQFDIGLYLNDSRQKTLVTSVGSGYPALSLSSSVDKRALTVSCGTSQGIDGLEYLAQSLGVAEANVTTECECQIYGYDNSGQLVQTYSTVLTSTGTTFQTYLPDINRSVVSLNIAVRYQFRINALGITLPFYDDLILTDQELANLRLLTIEDLVRGNDVSVIVLGLNGMPVPNATVNIGPETLQTDANGIAQFLGLPIGIYPILVTASNYSDYSDDVVISDTNRHVVIRMQGINATANFTVEDFYGQPKVVTVKYQDSLGQVVTMGPSDSFTLTGEYGTYQLEISAPGIVTKFVNFKVPEDSGSVINVDEQLVPMEIITVIDNQGPVTDFNVSYKHHTSNQMIQMQQVAPGVHRALVAPGTQEVHITHSNGLVQIEPMTSSDFIVDIPGNQITSTFIVTTADQKILTFPENGFSILRTYKLLTTQQLEPVSTMTVTTLLESKTYVPSTQNDIKVAFYLPWITVTGGTYGDVTTNLTAMNQVIYLVPGVSELTVNVSSPVAGNKTVTVVNVVTGAIHTETSTNPVFIVQLANGVYDITVTSPGYVPRTENHVIANDLTIDMSLALTNRNVEIYVTDGTVGLPGAEIHINGQMYITDSSGHVRFFDVPAGTYPIILIKEGYANVNDSITINGTSIDPVQVETYVMDTVVLRSMIQLVGPSQIPIVGHEVTIAGQTLTTDVDGTAIIWLTPGTYAYSFDATSINGQTFSGNIMNPSYLRFTLYAGFEYQLDISIGEGGEWIPTYPPVPGVNRVSLEINFPQNEDIVEFTANELQSAVFTSMVNQSLGDIEFSYDGIMYTPLTLPFSVNTDEHIWFRRSVDSLNGLLTLQHSSLTHNFDSVDISVNGIPTLSPKAPDTVDISIIDSSGNSLALASVTPGVLRYEEPEWTRPTSWPPRPTNYQGTQGIYWLIEHFPDCTQTIYFANHGGATPMFIDGVYHSDIPNTGAFIDLPGNDYGFMYQGRKFSWIRFATTNGADVVLTNNNDTLNPYSVKSINCIEELINHSHIFGYKRPDDGAVYSLRMMTENIWFRESIIIDTATGLFSSNRLFNVQNPPILRMNAVETFRDSRLTYRNVDCQFIPNVSYIFYSNQNRIPHSVNFVNGDVVTNMNFAFTSNQRVQRVVFDDASNVIQGIFAFQGCYSLQSLILPNYTQSLDLTSCFGMNKVSLLALIASLADMTGQSAPSMILTGVPDRNDIDVQNAAIAKNWMIIT